MERNIVMKYIRTKDKIIDLTSKQISSFKIIDDETAIDEYGEDGGFIMVYYYNQDVGEHIEYDNKGGHSMDNWYLKDILKQANTIEELCDEFVYIDEGSYPEVSDELDLMQTKSTIIFGAIWTDKGLIYVAKMNEKGELELL